MIVIINNTAGRYLDYEQSLFPLRDSQGKRTSELVRKSPVALKRDVRVEPTNAVGDFRTRTPVRFPRLSLSGKKDCS